MNPEWMLPRGVFAGDRTDDKDRLQPCFHLKQLFHDQIRFDAYETRALSFIGFIQKKSATFIIDRCGGQQQSDDSEPREERKHSGLHPAH